jgi:hypothetical protein
VLEAVQELGTQPRSLRTIQLEPALRRCREAGLAGRSDSLEVVKVATVGSRTD